MQDSWLFACRTWSKPTLARDVPGGGARSDDWLALIQLLRCRVTGEQGKGMDDRAFASATELSQEIRDRRIGCVELLDFYLARAERYNPALKAIVVWQVGQARERARAADAALAHGERWGPLHGIPMSVKESFNVAGLPTTFGNPLWKDNVAAENAFLVDRLLQAGAIVFGKTNVPYMLADAQSYNDIYGTTNTDNRCGRRRQNHDRVRPAASGRDRRLHPATSLRIAARAESYTCDGPSDLALVGSFPGAKRNGSRREPASSRGRPAP